MHYSVCRHGAGGPATGEDIWRSAIRAEIAEAEHAFCQIDVIVHNAGEGNLAAVEERQEAAIPAVFETSFFGSAAVIVAILL